MQTTKEGDNTITTEHSLGAIAIGPTGNSQLTHTFMNLNMGQYISRTCWTPLPIPQHIIDFVHQLANTQPCGLEFRNCNNQLMISEDDYMYNDTENDSYDPTEDDDSTDVTDVHSRQGERYR